MRRGPGLVGTVARTAVVAGTATAVSGSMIRHQNQKDQAAAEEQMAQQQAYENQAQLEEMQRQMAAMQAQQVQAAVPPSPPAAAPPPPPAAPVAAPAPAPAAPVSDMITQLQQLNELKNAGALTDAEFQAAKAKLLGTA
ncbi:MAG: SHOCT domain-containing protein [Chloroflexi bacterium]|nr:SHOCT domain-containing protein [Chloroflexota bacterium]